MTLEAHYSAHLGCLLDQHAPQAKRCAVAVSGGADSMALALLSYPVCLSKGIELVALTVDHGLRPESSDEAAQVKTWVEKLGLRHQTLVWSNPPLDATQDHARTARYELLINYCLDHGISSLLLGHHALDQAETVLMRFCKSSHFKGLRGMEDAVCRQGVMLLRPMLHVWPADLRHFLHNRQQDWVEDPSNQNAKYLRVIARQLLTTSTSPLRTLGLDAHKLLHWADKVSDSYDLIHQQILSFTSNRVSVNDDGFAINYKAFCEAPSALQTHVLECLLTSLTHHDYPPRWDSLRTASAALAAGKSVTLAGFHVQVQRDTIVATPELPRKKRLSDH